MEGLTAGTVDIHLLASMLDTVLDTILDIFSILLWM